MKTSVSIVPSILEKKWRNFGLFFVSLSSLTLQERDIFQNSRGILLYLKEYGFRCDTKNNKENIYQKLLKSIRENLLSLS